MKETIRRIISFLRRKHKSEFIYIRKDVFLDNNLSFKAKGVYGGLAARELYDMAIPVVNECVDESMQELIKFGYMKHKINKDGTGWVFLNKNLRSCDE